MGTVMAPVLEMLRPRPGRLKNVPKACLQDRSAGSLGPEPIAQPLCFLPFRLQLAYSLVGTIKRQKRGEESMSDDWFGLVMEISQEADWN